MSSKNVKEFGNKICNLLIFDHFQLVLFQDGQEHFITVQHGIAQYKILGLKSGHALTAMIDSNDLMNQLIKKLKGSFIIKVSKQNENEIA